MTTVHTPAGNPANVPSSPTEYDQSPLSEDDGTDARVGTIEYHDGQIFHYKRQIELAEKSQADYRSDIEAGRPNMHALGEGAHALRIAEYKRAIASNQRARQRAVARVTEAALLADADAKFNSTQQPDLAPRDRMLGLIAWLDFQNTHGRPVGRTLFDVKVQFARAFGDLPAPTSTPSEGA